MFNMSNVKLICLDCRERKKSCKCKNSPHYGKYGWCIHVGLGNYCDRCRNRFDCFTTKERAWSSMAEQPSYKRFRVWYTQGVGSIPTTPTMLEQQRTGYGNIYGVRCDICNETVDFLDADVEWREKHLQCLVMQDCRLEQNDPKYCDTCAVRFKCWTVI